MVDIASPTLRVAIVGAGPSGFFAAESLLRSAAHCEVTMIERLPTPHGLVRSGVAPDHPKLKQASAIFEKIARMDGFHYIGNVDVGRTASIQDILLTHDAVILAYGACEDQGMGIPGEQLLGSNAAREFVGWYNGHPDYRDLTFDLSGEVAVVVGQGNVALDVARILSKPVDTLRSTDIASHAIEVLAESRIKEIYIVGRRGPAQAKFTSAELREFGNIVACCPIVRQSDLALNEASQIEANDRLGRTTAMNLEILRNFASLTDPDAKRKCHFLFNLAPVALTGDTRVDGMTFARTELSGDPFSQRAVMTDVRYTLSCQLVLRAVGYRGKPMHGLPFDISLGKVPNLDGRVIDDRGRQLHGVYATGWIKRGPTGIIGTNRADSMATVEKLLSDFQTLTFGLKSGAQGLVDMLSARAIRTTSLADWHLIDAAEIAAGSLLNKPREKLTYVREMLDICRVLTADQSRTMSS